MRIALSEMVVEGIQTNIPLHRDLMNDTRFLRGGVSIHYLEHKLAQEAREILAAAGITPGGNVSIGIAPVTPEPPAANPPPSA